MCYVEGDISLYWFILHLSLYISTYIIVCTTDIRLYCYYFKLFFCMAVIQIDSNK